MTFSEAPWAVRFGAMGDMAESKFLEHCDGKAERFGLSRPEGVHVPLLPARMRGAPDFVTNNGLVECKGLGRAQFLQIKLETYGVMHYWRGLMPLWIFVWDSHKKRKCMISLEALDALLNTPDLINIGYFDDSKLVFRIPADAVFEAADGEA